MAETSMFRGALDFFVDLGIYDVILPFLLVFGLVFAILDKTKLLGIEMVGDTPYPKKNINAIIAFVVAFFVVASAKLVEVITTVSSQFVILLLLLVLFLALVGSFMDLTELKEKGVHLQGGWKQGFMGLSLVGISLIFLNALDWLNPIYEFLKDHWDNQLVATVILLAVVIGVIMLITKDKNKPGE